MTRLAFMAPRGILLIAVLGLGAGCQPQPQAVGLATAASEDPPNATPSPFPEEWGPCDDDQVVGHLKIGLEPPVTGLSVQRLYPESLWTQSPPGGFASVDPDVSASMQRRYVIKNPNGSLTQENLSAIRARYDDVELICPMAGLGAAERGAPTTLGTRWHYEATGADKVAPYIRAAITGGQGEHPSVLVAVLDSGVDNTVVPTTPNGWSYYPSTSAAPAWNDDTLGHGTSVASLIQQSSDGLADILSIKVLNGEGRGTGVTLVKGIAQSIDRRAEILNMSLGFPRDIEVPWGRMPDYMVEALQAVWSTGARVYAAAGNECGGPAGGGCQEFLPAAAPFTLNGKVLGITSVSGLRPDGGPSKAAVMAQADLWAPAELICSETAQAVNGSGHQRLTGTSFAVAQVSGATALFKALLKHQLAPAPVTATDMNTLQAMLLNAGSPILWPPGTCGSGVRLDMCKMALDMGEPVPGCQAWASPANPQTDLCPWTDSNPDSVNTTLTGVVLADGTPGYMISGGQPPRRLDHLTSAVWCEGYSSSPSLPPCTSCEVEMPVFSLSSFQMTLRVGVGWVNYSDWQLKLTNQDGDEAYVALAIDDEVSGSYLGGTITYDATLAPALTFVPDEAWLVNDEILSGNWAGLQLMLTLY